MTPLKNNFLNFVKLQVYQNADFIVKYDVIFTDSSWIFGHLSHLRCILFAIDFYTPPHKKWLGIMLYPPNFKCPSVRPSSVRQRFVSVL